MSGHRSAAGGLGVPARFAVPVLVGPALNPINTSLISVALIPIADALHVGSDTVIWLVAVLYLTSAVAQPTMGTLADRFGPRRIYLIGLAITAVAGAVPLVAHTFLAALLSRILLGIGTSAAYPTALALIRDESRRLGIDAPPALLSGLSISSLVTTAIGPVLGGVLIGAFGWEAVFAVNIPIALATLVLGFFWLHHDDADQYGSRGEKLTEAVDFAGIGLFALAIGAMLFFLLNLSVADSWLLIVSLAALAALIVWERRRDHPFIDVRLLAHEGALDRTYLRLFLTYSGFYTILYALSQWLQSGRGLSAGAAGLAQLPTALVAGAASFAIVRVVRVRLPLVVTAVAPILGGVALAFTTSHSPLWVVLVAAALFGVPAGTGSVANQVALYNQAPRDQIGTAGGLSRTSTSLGAIVSSSIIGIIFGHRPSDGGMHTISWVVVVIFVALLALTLADRALAGTNGRGTEGAAGGNGDETAEGDGRDDVPAGGSHGSHPADTKRSTRPNAATEVHR